MKERDVMLARLLGSAAMLSYILLRGRFRRGHYTKVLEQELEKSLARELYLAGMLDKYEIEIDEFDLIALRNL